MLTCMIVVSCTVLTDYRRLASSLRLPPHPLYSLLLVSHRFSSPDGCMFVYMEAQYVLVKTVIFSAKLSRFDRLPLLSSPRFVSPRATVRSASKSRSILSLISILSVSPSLLSFVIASSAYLDSQAYPYPSLLPFVTVRGRGHQENQNRLN